MVRLTMSRCELMSKEEFKRIIVRAQKKVAKNPEVNAQAEDFVHKYGTLSQNDLQKRFTL